MYARVTQPRNDSSFDALNILDFVDTSYGRQNRSLIFSFQEMSLLFVTIFVRFSRKVSDTEYPETLQTH